MTVCELRSYPYALTAAISNLGVPKSHFFPTSRNIVLISLVSTV